MPIRINLLAESQAAEESRRRDPVKRVIFAGALLVALMLVWSSSLQLEAMLAKKEVTDRLNQIQTQTNEFQRVQSDQKNLAVVKEKLEKLKQLENSRFLQGNLLNALQQINVDGVRLMRIRVSQNYDYTAGTKPHTDNGHVNPGRPGTVTEKTVVTLDARDASANPGDQVNRYKDAVAANAYFKSALSQTNVQLTFLSPQQTAADGKPFVLFTLECNFPEVTR